MPRPTVVARVEETCSAMRHAAALGAIAEWATPGVVIQVIRALSLATGPYAWQAADNITSLDVHGDNVFHLERADRGEQAVFARIVCPQADDLTDVGVVRVMCGTAMEGGHTLLEPGMDGRRVRHERERRLRLNRDTINRRSGSAAAP